MTRWMDTGASPWVSWPTGQDEVGSMPASGHKAKLAKARRNFQEGQHSKFSGSVYLSRWRTAMTDDLRRQRPAGGDNRVLPAPHIVPDREDSGRVAIDADVISNEAAVAD